MRLREFATATRRARLSRRAGRSASVGEAGRRSFAEMTALPAALRAALAEQFAMPRLEMAARQKSTDGTEKFLFRLPDGQEIETVAIPDGDRLTLCISSQAGCALQCAFCATGAMGFQRNLAAWEIAAQVREMALLDPPIAVTNIVFMGMGEPLMNWKRGRSRAHDPQQSAGARHRRAPHHRLHRGRAAGHRRARRAPGAVPPRDLDPRADRRAAARADADQHKYPLADVIAAGEGLRPARHVRVRHARRRERRAGARASARGARARVPRVRESDSAARGRRARVHGDRRRSASRASRARCARRASKWRFARAAAWTSPRRAASYG